MYTSFAFYTHSLYLLIFGMLTRSATGFFPKNSPDYALIETWIDTHVAGIEIWTLEQFMDRIAKYSCDLKSIYCQAEHLARMCPEEISFEYSLRIIEEAMNGIYKRVPYFDRRHHMIFGVQVNGFDNSCQHLNIQQVFDKHIYGYLIWSHKSIDSNTSAKTCPLGPSIVSLDLYFARVSSDGTYLDLKTQQTIPFEYMQRNLKTYTFTDSQQRLHRITDRMVSCVKRRICGVGDFLLCVWLIWCKRQGISLAILEVANRTINTKGRDRDESITLYHRYLQYGFLEVDAVKHIDSFSFCWTLPCMVCGLKYIDTTKWCKVLIDRKQQIFDTFEQHWKTVPEFLIKRMAGSSNVIIKEEVRTSYQNHVESYRHHIKPPSIIEPLVTRLGSRKRKASELSC